MSDTNVPVTEVAANDQELTRLMAGLPGMVYRASAQPPFVFEIVGGGYEHIFGRSAEDLVGKPEILLQTMHPDDASRYVETVMAAVDRREPFHLDHRLIQPDGTERVVWEKGRLLAMPDGRLVIEGSIVDIEEPSRARLVQDATYRISQATTSAESLQELYSHIHHIIAELMPSENLYLALRDPRTGFITYPYYIDEFDAVLAKPYSFAELTSVLASLADQSSILGTDA
jgi:PAS domain S-box-containing protein